MPANILNLPAYKVLKIEETDHDYHIKAEVANPPQQCPECAATSLVGFGRNEVMVRDLPSHGKRVAVYVDARRYRCKECGKTFMDRLPDVVPNTHMTRRLREWICEQALSRTFTSIANDVGVVEGTIRVLFREYIADLEKRIAIETPEWMGIDEIHLLGKPRCVITNIEECTVVDLLEDRNKSMLANYIFRMQRRLNVKCVTMDMWAPYRDVVRDNMPQAVIVVDKFHVLRMANLGLERVRKSIRESLTPKQRRGLMHDRFILLKRQAKLEPFEQLKMETWTRNFPLLSQAYEAKEGFFNIYEHLDRFEALEAYRSWRSHLSPGIQEAFRDLITATTNWEREIFAYFDHPVTNAYTESLNSLIRVVNRLGRGYSFEALRAKILYSEKAIKIKRPKFERRPMMDTFYYGRSTSTSPPSLFLGSEISTLARLIEEQKL